MDSNFKEISSGIFKFKDKLFTKNYSKGYKVYTEDILINDGDEYRSWDIYKSKLAAAIYKGLKHIPIKKGSVVLYLGASTGTTVSHISDIVGEKGIVFCVEFAKRPMRQLLGVCEIRDNLIPFLSDARRPEEYENIGEVDIIYQDVAQPDQASIIMKNSSFFLRSGSYALMCVKSQSIDSTKSKNEIYGNVQTLLKQYFTVEQKIELDPYDKDHVFLLLKKK